MIPILFEPSDTVFNSNGIGRLSDAISCKVKEARNGAFELNMVYPLNGVHFKDLVNHLREAFGAARKPGFHH